MESEITDIEYSSEIEEGDMNDLTFFERSPFFLSESLAIRESRLKMIMNVNIYDCSLNKYNGSTSNISSGGMAVIGNNDLQLGEKIFVHLRSDLSVKSEVVWRKSRKIGLKFENHINLIDVFGTSISVKNSKE